MQHTCNISTCNAPTYTLCAQLKIQIHIEMHAPFTEALNFPVWCVNKRSILATLIPQLSGCGNSSIHFYYIHFCGYCCLAAVARMLSCA